VVLPVKEGKLVPADGTVGDVGIWLPPGQYNVAWLAAKVTASGDIWCSEVGSCGGQYLGACPYFRYPLGWVPGLVLVMLMAMMIMMGWRSKR
jgi:hypothetical protein